MNEQPMRASLTRAAYVVGMGVAQFTLGTATFGFVTGGIIGYKARHNAVFNERHIPPPLAVLAGACAGMAYTPYATLTMMAHPVSTYRFVTHTQPSFSHWGVTFERHYKKDDVEKK